MTDRAASRASLLTPVGRGAVAVVAATGPAATSALEAHFHAASGRSLQTQPCDRIAFGHWHAGDHREEVVVCRTGEQRVEVHCHGGVAAAQRILDGLSVAGCRIEPWTEWVHANSDDLIVAEADVALASAATRRTAAILLDQRHGALRREIETVRCELAQQSATSLASAHRRLPLLVERAALGLRLTRPWIVAVAGRPNVGKSSLVNALAGYERAIVFDSPGTTRDVLAVETAIDGWPVRLTDSAGLRTSDDPLELAGVELARQQLARADLVVWVLDATQLPVGAQVDPQAIAADESTAEPVGAVPLVVVVNKADLCLHQQQGGGLRTSAVTGAGLDELLATISRRLVPHPPAPGDAVPFTARQVEALREAAAHLAAGPQTPAIAALDLLLGAMGPTAAQAD